MRKLLTLLVLSFICCISFSQTKFSSKIKGEQIIQKTYLTISYNQQERIPNYVGYVMNRKMLKKKVDRETGFYSDAAIPKEYRAYSFQYSNSGYDRGHMAPAANFKFNKTAMHETFSLANICPQKPKLNRVYWEKLEEVEREMVEFYDTLYVVTGHFCKPHNRKYIDKSIIIPDAFYKAYVAISHNEIVMCMGYFYSNSEKVQKLEKCQKSINELEKILGINLYPWLAEKYERKIYIKE